MAASDPFEYYACLGLQSNAPPSVVRAAYRVLAQEWHPDRNSSAEATAKFQTLQRAYEVLSDSAKRAAYDAGSSDRVFNQAETRHSDNPPATSTWEPVRCSRCRAVTASPRYRVFLTIIGCVLKSSRRSSQGVYCAQCEMIVGCRCTGLTLIAGWWSIDGFIWTNVALYRNLFSANAFAEQTAKHMAVQASYFLSVGKPALAYAVAVNAYSTALKVKPISAEMRRRSKLGYEDNHPLQALRIQLKAFLLNAEETGALGPPLKSTTGIQSPAFRSQGGIILAFAILVGTCIWSVH